MIIRLTLLLGLFATHMGITKSSQNCVHASLISSTLGLEPRQNIIIDAEGNLRFARRNRQAFVSYRIGPIFWRSRRSILCKDNLRIGQGAKLLPICCAFSALCGIAATMLFLHDLLPFELK